MSQPFVGEIRLFPYNFAPLGWLDCNGQTLQISEYETLYALIGTTYGGDGAVTFMLPNLSGRVPIHQGTGPGLGTYVMGQAAGTAAAMAGSVAVQGIDPKRLQRVLRESGCLLEP